MGTSYKQNLCLRVPAVGHELGALSGLGCKVIQIHNLQSHSDEASGIYFQKEGNEHLIQWLIIHSARFPRLPGWFWKALPWCWISAICLEVYNIREQEPDLTLWEKILISMMRQYTYIFPQSQASLSGCLRPVEQQMMGFSVFDWAGCNRQKWSEPSAHQTAFPVAKSQW